MNDDASEFIAELEKRFDGTITYRTYCTWYGSTKGIIRDFGVFMYAIHNVFHFEDFERKPALFGIALTGRKKQAAYVKMEDSFKKDEIESITQVSKSKAMNSVKNSKNAGSIPLASLLEKIFSPLVTRVTLKNGETHFFELINHKEFLQYFRGEM